MEELVENIDIFPDHLEAGIAGAPKVNVTLREAGLRGGLPSRPVGGRTRIPMDHIRGMLALAVTVA